MSVKNILSPSYTYCEKPHASGADIAAWNSLSLGTSTNAEMKVKVGLFGWDFTCIYQLCSTAQDPDESCRFLEKLFEDQGTTPIGLALGINWNFTTLQYASGFSYSVLFDNKKFQ